MELKKIKRDINKIFLLSDLHFGIRGNSFEWLENQLAFFYNFYIPFLKEKVKAGDILLICGDWFDNRQTLDIYIINRCQILISELSKILPIYFIPGNHDNYKKNDTNVISLVVFKNIPNVNIIYSPTILINKEYKYLLLPWVGDNDNEQKYLKNEYDAIFAHFNIIGMKMDNGMPITNGVDVSNIKNYIISGHIHKQQSSGKSVYLGSPYHLKRSDINNTKGCYIFDTNDQKLTFTPNNISPIYQRVHINFILNSDIETVKNIFNNNYTDIILTNEYINKFNLSKFIDILNAYNCNYKKIEIIVKDQKNDEQLFLNNSIQENKDIKSIIEDSINILDGTNDLKNKLRELNNFYYKQLENEN